MNALMTAQDPMQAGMVDYAAEAEPQYQEWSLEKKVACFEDAEESSESARAMSEKCRDYYDNKQLTADELRTLALRGQPDIIINRIQSKCNYLFGYEATLRTDPRGRPRTPEDEEASEACTDALNYVRDNGDQKQCFSQVWENMVIEGAGGTEVVPVLKDNDAEITFKKAHWDRLFWDPHSREHDFSDARYLGYVLWMDEEDAHAQWPEGREFITSTLSDEAKLTYSDRPHYRQWATAGQHRKRVRIVQMYYKCKSLDGKDECWHWCIFTKRGQFEGGMVPYRDDNGKSLCPLVLESAFIDRQNNRYGYVQAMLGPQDEINKRRSKMLHEATVRQFKYEEGALDDVDFTKREVAKPDGAIKINPGFDFEFIDRSKEIAAHAQLATEAKQEIELMGPNVALQGKGPDASGRAKLVDQQGGQIEIAILIDRHNHYKSRVHQLVWAMIKLYWTAEKWINVTDDEDNVRFVGFNRPLTLAEVLLKRAEKEGVPPDEAKATLRDAAADPMLRMQLEQVVDHENVPSRMGMDIILEEIPDNANIQQEQFAVLADLAKVVPLPPKLIIKASALRNKKELLDELDKAAEAEANDPMAQQETMLKIEGAMAEIEKLRAEVAKLIADTKNIEADSVKKLAEADAVDQQIGSVIDPEVVSADGSVTPARETPQAMPTPQSPAIKAAIQSQASQMMPEGVAGDFGAPQSPVPTPQMPLAPPQFPQQQTGF